MPNLKPDEVVEWELGHNPSREELETEIHEEAADDDYWWGDECFCDYPDDPECWTSW